jgi:DNA excision repair protein ERCC-4
MTSSSRSATLLSDFLSTMDPDAPKGAQGREMMEDKLRLYLWWKGKLSERKRDGKAPFHLPDVNSERQMDGFDQGEGLSEAMKLKDKLVKEKNASRRRVRGGAPAPAASGSGRSAAKSSEQKGLVSGEEEMRHEAEDIADLWVSFPFHFPSIPLGVVAEDCGTSLATQGTSTHTLFTLESGADPVDNLMLDLTSADVENEFDVHYGLLAPQETVIVRAYSDDSDDQVLADMKPKFIVMFEPNEDFIRRIEVNTILSMFTAIPKVIEGV